MTYVFYSANCLIMGKYKYAFLAISTTKINYLLYIQSQDLLIRYLTTLFDDKKHCIL